MSGAGEATERAELLARILRQRRELGEERLFLGGLDRDELADLIGRIRRGDVAASAGTPAPAPDAAATGSAEPGGDGAPDTVELTAEERAVRSGRDGENVIRTLDYGRLETVALGCERCRLAGERTQVVFSDGNPKGRLMVVGEAPGAREDETGLPFVGPAGKLLDLLLAAVGLSREKSVYICNVLKCRPPGNRDPLPDEIESCTPYLRRQIELVSPELILGVGRFAGQFLTGRTIALGKLRGEVYSYEGVPVVVTYHPAALLRNASWTRATWDDFQLVRRILDEG